MADDLVSEHDSGSRKNSDSHNGSFRVASTANDAGNGGLTGTGLSPSASDDPSTRSTLSRQESENRIRKLQRTKDFVMVTSKVEGTEDGGTYHKKVIFRARDPSLSLFSARAGTGASFNTKKMSSASLARSAGTDLAPLEEAGGSGIAEESSDEEYDGEATQEVSHHDDDAALDLDSYKAARESSLQKKKTKKQQSKAAGAAAADSESSEEESDVEDDDSDYGDVHTVDDMTTTTVEGNLADMFEEITTQPNQEDGELEALNEDEQALFDAALSAGLPTPSTIGWGDVKASDAARRASRALPISPQPASASAVSPISGAGGLMAMAAAAAAASAKTGGTVSPPISSPPASPRLLPDSRDVEIEQQAARIARRASPFRSSAGGADGGLGIVYAVADAVGRRSGMEDRYAAVMDLKAFAAEELATGNIAKEDGQDGARALAASTAVPRTAIFGVFDGHNGSGSSEYLAQRLPIAIATNPHFESDLEVAVTEASLRVDEEYLDHAEANRVYDGSTAVMLLLRERPATSSTPRTVDLLCANVGDSRAVLSRAGEAVELSDDHKCTREDEQLRVEAAGGWVSKSRLCGVIAVSRSFGDIEHKRLKNECWGKEFTGDTLIALPEYRTDCLHDDGTGFRTEEEFVIVACDGLWDVMTCQQAVNFVRRSISRDGDASKAARDLVQKALDLQTIDNCSACIVFFTKAQAAVTGAAST
jgi:serine/threonine protein phosphatase PrpC/ribosome assembly protein YihI (activator of Der GTPase)